MRHIFPKAKKYIQILLKSKLSAQILLKSQFYMDNVHLPGEMKQWPA